MSTGDLIGMIASVFGLLTCKESLPALIWLALVIIFGIRFEKALKQMESNKENYDYPEDEDE